MATTSQGTTGPTTKKSTTKRTTTRRSTTGRRSTSARQSARAATTSTQPTTPIEQVGQIAERAVLVPVGASLLVRDNLVSTVRVWPRSTGLARTSSVSSSATSVVARAPAIASSARSARPARGSIARCVSVVAWSSAPSSRTAAGSSARFAPCARDSAPVRCRRRPGREAGLGGPGPDRLAIRASPARRLESANGGRVRRPHNLAGGRSTLSSLNRRGVTQVAPRRSSDPPSLTCALRECVEAGSRPSDQLGWACLNGNPCPP